MSPTRGSLLVVDDEPSVCAAFRRATKHMRLRFRFALSAEEALRLIQAEVPELLVTDYRLPGMDGLALLRRVKAEHPSVRGILYTADEVARQALGLDVPILDKPCALETLQALLAEFVTPAGIAG